MQTIEINTAQNVRIEYELAGIGQRISAFVIDLFIMMMVLVLLELGLEEMEFSTLGDVFAFLWLGFYTLGFEMLGNGQTPGKRAMGIKVIKLNGEELVFYDYFSRWSMRLVDIYLSLGSIAVLLIAGNKNGQRLGDILAGSSVIRKRSHYTFSLKDILKLNERKIENSEILYPKAALLEEKDVLLIKQLLHRRRLYPNRAHDEALQNLSDRMAEILEADIGLKNREEFLNRVISEYIILTR